MWNYSVHKKISPVVNCSFVIALILFLVCLFILGIFSGFICNVCDKWFSSRITLTKHIIWHHKETCPNFKYNCHLCPYASHNLTNFRKHSAVHNHDRTFECDICHNRFSTQASLSQHMLIHFGENRHSFIFSS